MKNNIDVKSISLMSLYILGCGIINYNFTLVSQPLIFLTVYTSAFCLFFCLCGFVFKTLNKSKKPRFALWLFPCCVCLFSALGGIINYCKFIKKLILPQNSIISVIICTAVFFAVLFFTSNSAFLKYCLLIFVITAVFVIVLFIGGIENFETADINFSAINQSLCFNSVFTACVSALPIAVFWFSCGGNFNKNSATLGVLIGFLTLFLCFAQSFLTLGNNFNSEFIYIKSVSVISAGSIFTRLDGLAFFVISAAQTVNITVCLKVIKHSVTAFKKH